MLDGMNSSPQACSNASGSISIWDYCLEVRFDPYAAKDAIEERPGVKLEYDCQIVNNELENRRKSPANAFVADLGELDGNFNFF